LKDNTIYIGLCLAGAVSAGAYTAGVIDFLLETLDEWEIQKEKNDPEVPAHQIKIAVIGGASAGGMTGILLSVKKDQAFKPVRMAPSNIHSSIPGNPFYNAWVDLTENDLWPLLLACNDLKGDAPIYSILNSSFIDKMVNASLRSMPLEKKARPYFSEPLKTFVTLCNLEGFRYNISMNANDPERYKYVMGKHADLACFHISENKEYLDDGWIPVNPETGFNTDIMEQAARATGAFPLVLKARFVSRPGKVINDLQWNRDITKHFPVSDEIYEALCVDGGIINNEPFEYVRQLLNQITGESVDVGDYNSFDTFKSTVLLVDPFPSEPELFNCTERWNYVAANTLQAMLDQMRMKPFEMMKPFNQNLSGQFMISPMKQLEVDGIPSQRCGSSAIACGGIWGFAGFFSKEFRVHDYFLGRANCEKFLREKFTVPLHSSNPIIKFGYKKVKNKQKYLSANGGLQIIPVFRESASNSYMPSFYNGEQWPTIAEKDIYKMRPLMKKRIEVILRKLGDYSTQEKILLWIGSKVLLSGKISDIVISQIIRGLKSHQLIK